MKSKDEIFGVKGSIVRFFHKTLLFTILYNSMIEPSRAMIVDYFANNGAPTLRYKGYRLLSEEQTPAQKESAASQDLAKGFSKEPGTYHKTTKPSLSFYEISPDIKQGTIGKTSQNPTDDPDDNLFKFNIANDLPATATVFLTYDLYGVQDFNAVGRSINQRRATGGYLVKQQAGWSSQREQIDADWLKAGENHVLFSIPAGGNYQYSVRNVKIEISTTRSQTNLIINRPANAYTKDNQFYVKGFVRNAKPGLRLELENQPLHVNDGEYEGFLALSETVKNRKFAVLRAFDETGLLGQELVFLDILLEADQKFNREAIPDSGIRTFSEYESGLLQIENASIQVGQDAVCNPAELSVTRLRSIDMAPMGPGMVNVTKGEGYRFLPDRMKFDKPVTISIAYDEKLLPPGKTAKDIRTFYFNTASKSWAALETDSINAAQHAIVSHTDHFTDYINGVIQTPESPETQAFTPTMMNDVKAADPSAEMTIINPPQVSQKGEAGVQYPLKIPTGRKGMQPELTIHYSNQGANSWLGQGWILNTPSISLDTRWGTPTFDVVNESEMYQMNGEQLMYPRLGDSDWMPNRHYDVNGNPGIFNTSPRQRLTGAAAVFTPRKQGSFTKIERLGNSPSTYYWKVTDGNGVVNWYGGKNAVVPEAVITSAGNVVHWALYMTEDVHGNNVKYYYNKETLSGQSGDNANLNGGQVFHVRDIYYTGFNNEDGKYQIHFKTKGSIRQDQVVTARLGIKQIEPRFLDEITVSDLSVGSVRKFKFDIGYGRFGKGQLRAITEFDANNSEFYKHEFEYYDDVAQPDGDHYFSAGVTQTICNDCVDTDNDTVCDDVDQCLQEAGPASNNGCPEAPACYYVDFLIPSGSGPHTVSLVTSTGTLSIGQFNLNTTAGFDLMVQTVDSLLPSGAWVWGSNQIGPYMHIWFSPATPAYLVINSGGNTFSYAFQQTPCAMRPPSAATKDYARQFASMADNFEVTFSGSQTFGDPDCPVIVNSDFLITGNIPGFNSASAILGSTVSENLNIGGHLGFGIDFSWDPTTKNITLGGAYNHSWDTSESLTSIVDINGDGLLDIVFKSGDQLYWKKHTLTRTYDTNNLPIVTHGFENYRPINSINNDIHDFYRSKGESSSTNFQINFGISGVGLFAGWDSSRNNSTNMVYFTDANSDGLTDIVKYGVVYFNRLDSAGNPYFETESINTENLLIQAEPVTVTPVVPLPAFDYPNYDVVKVWEAPADGNIKITSNATNLDPAKEAVITIEKEKKLEGGCNGGTVSSGGDEMEVFTYTVDFGPDTGIAGIYYDAQSVPDKFDITWNGQTFSSGYRGSNTNDAALLAAGVPQSEINTTPPPGNGQGVLCFNKTSALPNTATITVTTKISGTLWSLHSFCPQATCPANYVPRFSPQSPSLAVETKKCYDVLIDKAYDEQPMLVYVDNVPLNPENKGYVLLEVSENNQQAFGMDDFISHLDRIFHIQAEKTPGGLALNVASERRFGAIVFKALSGEVRHSYAFRNYDCPDAPGTIVNQAKAPESPETVNPSSCAYEPADLCLLYGAKLNQTSPSSNTTILNSNSSCNPGAGSLSVKRGDRIYFRVHSVAAGNPEVNWNPKVEYTNATLAATTDQNGLTLYNSSYSDGFVLSRELPVVFPGNGTATISWEEFVVNEPTDAVTVQIVERTQSGAMYTDQVLYSQVCNPNAVSWVYPMTGTVTAPATINNNQVIIPVTGTTDSSVKRYLFRLFATSNVDWKSINWKPKMVCTTTQTVAGSTQTVTTAETKYPIVDYSIYKPFLCGPNYLTTTVTGTNVGIKPSLPNSLFSSTDNGKVYFVVKKGNDFLGRRVFTVTGGNVTVDLTTAIPLGTGSTHTVEIGFYSDDSARTINSPTDVSLLLKILNAANIAQIMSGTTSVSSVSVNQANFWHKPNALMGTMYRQWGQFMYNPSATTTGTPLSTLGVKLMDENLLTITNAQATSLNNLIYGSVGSTTLSSTLTNIQNADVSTQAGAQALQSQMQMLQDQFDQLNTFPFMVANPTRDFDGSYTEKWMGFHAECYSSAAGARAARLEQAHSSEVPGESNTTQATLMTGAFGIDKVSDGEAQSVSAGGSASVVGASGTFSLGGESRLRSDYVDLNGDSYPDIVTESQVQFTRKMGGLFAPNSRTVQGAMSIDNNDNWGLSASGSFGKAGKPNPGSEGAGPLPDCSLRIGKPASCSFGMGNSSLGLSGSYSEGSNNTARLWVDINGDGLADIINDSGNVWLNMGNNTFNTVSWGNFPIGTGSGTTFGGGLGFNWANGSIEAGVSLGRTDSDTENTLADVNADGILDKVHSSSNNIDVAFSRGNKFMPNVAINEPFNYENSATTTTAGINGTGTYSLIWPLYLIFIVIPLKIPDVSATVSGGTSTNRTKKSIIDFDSDGYPDLVEEINTSTVRVFYSNIRRTDMLKSVKNPLGGKYTVDYKVQPVTYDNPSAKWAMSDLVIEDNYDKVNDGVDVYKKSFVYEDGRYDRREREFYGYATVKEIEYNVDENNVPTTVYRTHVSKYHNRSYFLHGLPTERYMLRGDDENQKFTRDIHTYQIKELGQDNNSLLNPSASLPDDFDVGGTEGRRTAAVVKTKTTTEYYEFSSSPMLIHEEEMEYDPKGRVHMYYYRGDVAVNTDDYEVKINYHEETPLVDKNILNIPTLMIVSAAGTDYRIRQTEVDTSNGNITKIMVATNDSSTWAETTMGYYDEGNLKEIIFPANDDDESMAYYYEYDTTHKKYVISTKDAFSYTSTAIYDSRFDKIVQAVDVTGNKMVYEYDSFGRLASILAPKEIEAGIKYTMRFFYYPYYSSLSNTEGISEEDFVPVALTQHYDTQHPDNPIETLTFIDGLVRVVQVKKDITLNKDETHLTAIYYEAMSVSGKTHYDEFARDNQKFHPFYETKHNILKFRLNEYDAPYNDESVFDVADRTASYEDAAGKYSYFKYSIDQDDQSILAMKIRSVVDQNGNQNVVSESFKDVNGRVISKMDEAPGGQQWTHFYYDPLGQLLTSVDAESISTKYEYDMSGRKTAIHHPDRGITRMIYDKANNLTKLQTQKLANDNTLDPEDRFIKYIFEINRIEKVEYPDMPNGSNISNVYYKYGSTGNETGRLIYQHDASGEQSFKYGNMGEVIENTRVVVGPNIPTRVFKTTFAYDSWNRLQVMAYPDGEKVKFGYDLGGNLVSMNGTVYGNSYDYIKRLDYDHYEQRAYLLYGNETQTFYNYTPELRRLGNMKVKDVNQNDLLNNFYEYDYVGNVAGIKNAAGISSNNFGGDFQHSYEYDIMNRLKGAKGEFAGSPLQQNNGNDFQASYQLSMDYNASNGVKSKKQEHMENGNTVATNTYANEYSYVAGTHRIDKISDTGSGNTEYFKHDANGNIEYRNNQVSETMNYWDESDRLRVVLQMKDMQHYIYDGAGERVLKANTSFQDVYENGELITPQSAVINGYTTYASGFLVIDPQGIYSKHYYAGTQRIVSRIGEQESSIFNLENCNDCKSVSGDELDEKKIRQAQKDDLEQILKKTKSEFTVTYKDYQPYTEVEAEKALQEGEEDQTNESGAAAAPSPDDPPAMDLKLYFYHPDYLSTATYLTSSNGKAYQFFLNLPFGETMAEQLPGSYYKTPYKFTSKELDEETGLYYYGARYYDPRISVWYSVDPLAEKAPSWTPYRYCFNNPVRFTDPTGLFEGPGDEFKTPDEAAKDFALNYNGQSIINNVEVGAVLYQNKNGTYSYTEPTGATTYELRKNDIGVPLHYERVANIYSGFDTDKDKLPKGAKVAGVLHTHAWDRSGRKETAHMNTDNQFSPEDKQMPTLLREDGYGKLPIYVVTPDGQLKCYGYMPDGSFRMGNKNIGGNDIPSDPLSPTRKNKVSPNVTPTIDASVIDERSGQPLKLHKTFNPGRRYTVPLNEKK